MSGRMQAAVIASPRRADVAEVPLPDPGPGQLRVRLEGCGVCASNLSPWEGQPWFAYPLAPGAPGHEGWGIVDAVGRGVQGLAEGDRVAVLSDLAYAEYDISAAGAAVPLPPALAGRPFPGEAIGCALNVFRRSGVRAGHTVAVVGVGFLGALLTQLCVRAGAVVVGLSRRPEARQLAQRFGAALSVPLDDRARALAEVQELTGGRGCDRVLECVGRQEALDLAAQLTRERGRLVIAGYHQDGPRQVDMQLWNWRGFDVINAHERDPVARRDGVAAAVEAVVSGALDPWPLLTHAFPLAELGAALEATRDRPAGFLKAVVVP